jgi:putative membrane protein
MMGGFDGGMMGGWGAFGWLGMLIQLLFFGGFLALIAWAITRIFPTHHDGGDTHRDPRKVSAENVLRERFARGEIDAEEYEERRRILNGGT